MARRVSTKVQAKNGRNLGFEAQLWAAADAMRKNVDAAGYKHVVLGLVFLKCISDAFETKHSELDAPRSEGLILRTPPSIARGPSGFRTLDRVAVEERIRADQRA